MTANYEQLTSALLNWTPPTETPAHRAPVAAEPAKPEPTTCTNPACNSLTVCTDCQRLEAVRQAAEQTEKPATVAQVARAGMSDEARALRAKMQNEDADTVAAVIRAEAPELVPHVKKVGAWLWAEFDTKPAEEIRAKLKSFGFSWNRTREAWQNPCGVFRRRCNRHDPRSTYGQEEI